MSRSLNRTALVDRKQFDPSPVPRRSCQPGIAGNQGNPQRLRETHKSRIVGRHVMAKFPDASYQRMVGIPHYRKTLEVLQRVGGPLFSQAAPGDQPPQRMQELHIDQVGSVKLKVFDQTIDEPWGRRAGDQSSQDGGGVDHQHRATGVSRDPGRT